MNQRGRGPVKAGEHAMYHVVKGDDGGAYHEAQMRPLAEEVSVDVDTVGLTKVFRDERAYCG